MKRKISVFSGAVLLSVSLFGVIHACRVAAAQNMYFRALSVRESRGEVKVILSLCESADRIYSHNYLFSILAAQEAYYTSLGAVNADTEKRVLVAEHWCNAGLSQNIYRIQLRKLKAYLLARKSATDAAACWERYVDWHFWEPANHAFLVELYSLSGQFDKALNSLALIKETPCYEEARKKMIDAWDRESSLPPEYSSIKPSGSQR